MNQQHERVADLVRAEVPHKSIYGLIVLNLTLLIVLVFGSILFYRWQERQDMAAQDRAATQAQWNATFRGDMKGLALAVEFGPRIAALEQGQRRQTEVLEAIAKKLGIKGADQ